MQRTQRMEMHMFTWQWIHWAAPEAGSKNTDDADLPGSKARGTKGQGARMHSSPSPPSSSSPFTSQQSTVLSSAGLIRAAHADGGGGRGACGKSAPPPLPSSPPLLPPLLHSLLVEKYHSEFLLPACCKFPENNREYERLKLGATVSTAVQQYRNTSSLGPHPLLHHPTVSLWHLGCFVTKAPSTHTHTQTHMHTHMHITKHMHTLTHTQLCTNKSTYMNTCVPDGHMLHYLDCCLHSRENVACFLPSTASGQREPFPSGTFQIISVEFIGR